MVPLSSIPPGELDTLLLRSGAAAAPVTDSTSRAASAPHLLEAKDAVAAAVADDASLASTTPRQYLPALHQSSDAASVPPLDLMRREPAAQGPLPEVAADTDASSAPEQSQPSERAERTARSSAADGGASSRFSSARRVALAAQPSVHGGGAPRSARISRPAVLPQHGSMLSLEQDKRRTLAAMFEAPQAASQQARVSSVPRVTATVDEVLSEVQGQREESSVASRFSNERLRPLLDFADERHGNGAQQAEAGSVQRNWSSRARFADGLAATVVQVRPRAVAGSTAQPSGHGRAAALMGAQRERSSKVDPRNEQEGSVLLADEQLAAEPQTFLRRLTLRVVVVLLAICALQAVRMVPFLPHASLARIRSRCNAGDVCAWCGADRCCQAPRHGGRLLLPPLRHDLPRRLFAARAGAER